MIVSKKALDDARKLLGKPPYDDWGNMVRGDGYFAQDRRGHHGKKVWEEACRIVSKE